MLGVNQLKRIILEQFQNHKLKYIIEKAKFCDRTLKALFISLNLYILIPARRKLSNVPIQTKVGVLHLKRANIRQNYFINA